MSDDCSRTARGPNRAPVRYETPPSYGIPTSATSSPAAVAAAGRGRNACTLPNRGGKQASRRPGRLPPTDLRLPRRPHVWDGGPEVAGLAGGGGGRGTR